MSYTAIPSFHSALDINSSATDSTYGAPPRSDYWLVTISWNGETMRFKQRLAGVLAAVLVTGTAVFGTTTPAFAGCQTTVLQYTYYTSSGGLDLWTRSCSGTYSLNSYGYSLKTGGWSGTVKFANGTKILFCDWEDWDLTAFRPYGHVVQIVMNVTKASWCN